MVGGSTAMVEGQQVPPWQAWGLSVLSATILAKSPSSFSLLALLLNQTLAVILGFLGLLGPRLSGLSGLRVLRVHWAMTPSRPEVWQPDILLTFSNPLHTRTPLITFTLLLLITLPQCPLRKDVSVLVPGTQEDSLVLLTHQS